MVRGVPFDEPTLVTAHQHCFQNRDEVLSSELCGCFYCLATFTPAEIVDWLTEVTPNTGVTAFCPKCGIDAVLGSRAGYPLTMDFLAAMRLRWFSVE